MRRLLLLAMFLLLMICVSAEEYVYRKVNWGMSRTDVILSEDKLPIVDDAFQLVYRSNDDPVLQHIPKNTLLEIYYNFNSKGVLVAIFQRFIAPFPQNYDYIKLYNDLTKYLENKYGPGDYKEVWENEKKEGNLINLMYVGALQRGTIYDQSVLLLQQAENNPATNTPMITTTIAYTDPTASY